MADKDNDLDKDPTLQEEAVDVGADQVEEWQGELPPEDDFHDQDEMIEEVGEEQISEDVVEESYEEAAQIEKKKRGKNVLFAIMVIGVFLIGGLAYLQFATGDEGGPLAVPAAAVLNVDDLKEKKQPPVTSQTVGAAPTVAGKTGSADLDKMYEEAQQRAGSKVVLPTTDSLDLSADKPMIGTSTDMITSSSEAPVPMPPNVEPASQTAAPASVIPQISSTKEVPPLPRPVGEDKMAAPTSAGPSSAAPAPDVLKPVSVSLGAVDPANKPAPAAQTAEMDARIKNMSAQIEVLKKSLDEAMAQNTKLLARLDAMQKEEAMEKALQPVEPAIVVDKMPESPKKQKAPQATKPVADAEFHVDAMLDQAPSEGEDEAAPARIVEKKPAKKAVKPAPKKQVEKKPSSKAQSPQWVLRAATPDAAWVSVGRDSQELRRVAVGESLPGIGRIQEIRQNGEIWEVVGEVKTLR